MNLKVAVIGDCRSGKSTLVASMLSQLVYGPANEFANVGDRTEYDGQCTVLETRCLELESRLERAGDQEFMVDFGPDHRVNVYSLVFRFRDARNCLDMQIVDIPGSFLGSPHLKEVCEMATACDAVIVTLDTPCLMTGDNAHAQSLTAAPMISEVLTSLTDNRKRLVVFAPVKCEKWAHERCLDDVVRRVSDLFRPVVSAFDGNRNCTAVVIPVETAGSLVFSSFSEPTVIVGRNVKRCRQLAASAFVQLSDGRVHRIQPDECLTEDPTAVSNGCRRLWEWFTVDNSRDPLYGPRNADQPALHILRFVVGGLVKYYQSLPWAHMPSPARDLAFAVDRNIKAMESAGILKDNCDGIKYL